MIPNADAIRAQLDRLSASSALSNSHRLNRFLRFVVERTLAGESDRLKEYVIGIEVFDRDGQYDPRIDSIVRVEAGRLRAKLDEYYNDAGRLDPIIISVQRGSYTPTFAERRSEPQPPPALMPLSAATPRSRLSQRIGIGAFSFMAVTTAMLAWYVLLTPPPAAGPMIAVLPFSIYATDSDVEMLAMQITEGISAELVANGALGVVSSTSARRLANSNRTLHDIAAELGADWLLQGRLHVNGNQVSVETVLIVGATDQKAWVGGFTSDIAELDDLERRIAAATARAARDRDLR